MQKFSFLATACFFIFQNFYVIAQDNVGIGTPTPNPYALLDLTATDKGLLIPRLSDAQRLALTLGASETGLLVYGATDNLFYYWDGTQWIALNPAAQGGFNTALNYNSTTGELSITDDGGTLTTVITPGGSSDSLWCRDNVTGLLYPCTITDNVSIGSATAHPSASLDVQSTTTGFLSPRLTTTQRLAISNPAAGLEVFDTDAGVKMFYNGNRWLEVGGDPIGTIKAWHKDFTNTPALPWGWVECDGQAIADTESPYNGENAPDLNNTFISESSDSSNAGYFLRGGTTSGIVSSDQTNNVGRLGSQGDNGCQLCESNQPIPQDGNWTTGNPGYDRNNRNTSYRIAHRGIETHPGNMTVVWILRVK